MGTRSRIGIKNDDGTITSVYCHWDGYLSHNGKLLLEHWDTPKKVKKLLKMGDMAVLGKEIGKKHDYYNNDNRGNGCTFYKRDRGEDDVAALVHSNEGEFLAYREEYNYLMIDGVWHVAYYKTGDIFVPLTENMVKKKETAGAD
jgi:hypothetical protein